MSGDTMQASLQSQRHLLRDFTVICCNEQRSLMIYIGLAGSNTASLPLLSAPKDQTCFPRQALTFYGQAMDALENTAEKCDAGEDDSQEYALAHDPSLRGKQLAMHEYAWPTNKSLRVHFKSVENQSTDELRLKSSDMRKNRKLRLVLSFMRAVTRMHKFAITP